MSGGQHGPPFVAGPEVETGGLVTRGRIALAVFAAAAAYFLLAEHRAHTIQALPWLILLLCPLMHLFMHRGHGANGSGEDGGSRGGSQ